MLKQVELLNPVVQCSVKTEKAIVETLDALKDKVAGIMYAYVDWRGFRLFSNRLKILLKERCNVKEIIEWESLAAHQGGAADVQAEQKTKEELFGKMARTVDFIIIGAAFCGSCTYYTAETAAELTRRHIPTLAITNTGFESLFRAVARSEGFEDLNVLVLPGDINILHADEINKITEERLPEIESRILGKIKAEVKRNG
jgi:hypothetical protein